MTFKTLKKIALLSFIIGATSCYYDSDERINISIKNECNLDNVTYETCVKSIMENNCKGCHNASNASGGIKLDTYANTKANYNLSMTAINNGSMPPPSSPDLTAENITILTNWGAQGLKE